MDDKYCLKCDCGYIMSYLDFYKCKVNKCPRCKSSIEFYKSIKNPFKRENYE